MEWTKSSLEELRRLEYRLSRTDEHGDRYVYNDEGLRKVLGFMVSPAGVGVIRTDNGSFHVWMSRGRLMIGPEVAEMGSHA